MSVERNPENVTGVVQSGTVVQLRRKRFEILEMS